MKSLMKFMMSLLLLAGICLSASQAFAIDVHITAYAGEKMVDDVRISWKQSASYKYKIQCPSGDRAFIGDYAIQKMNQWRSKKLLIWMTHRNENKRYKICRFN